MNFTVTGLTVETKGMTAEQLEDAKLFSGKNAGICYMGDSYFDSAVTDPVKATKRFVNTCNNGHHSIADHVRIEVLLEGSSKMLAIVLNSLQDYATSEKSGRYTVMTGNSERETVLYDKWKEIFHNRILELYPTYDDEMLLKKFEKKYPESGYTVRCGKLMELDANLDVRTDIEANNYFRDVIKVDTTLPSWKMAQENARYVLSVFTYSTTFGYSTSLRQWNYIYDWCQRYINQYTPQYDMDYVKWEQTNGKEGKCILLSKSTGIEASYFETRLYFDLLMLSNFIYDNLYVEELRDNKNRCFEFLTSLSGVEDHPMKGYDLSCYEPDGYTDDFNYTPDTRSSDDYFGLVYNTSYTASFVHIAQAERHRTLKYFMFFNPNFEHPEFFIPPMLLGTDYVDEWLSDLDSVKDLVPQAIKVCIVETGHISDFILKCEERLCGRAQLEIMQQTSVTAAKFIEDVDSGVITNKACINYVKKLRGKSGKINTKCQMLSCKEGCTWGSKNALTRLI